MSENLRLALPDEKTLIEAEGTLEIWACVLAECCRDHDAAECIRAASKIRDVRMSFLESEKRQ